MKDKTYEAWDESKDEINYCMQMLDKACSLSPKDVLESLLGIRSLMHGKVVQLARSNLRRISKTVKKGLAENLKEEYEFLKDMDEYILSTEHRCSKYLTTLELLQIAFAVRENKKAVQDLLEGRRDDLKPLDIDIPALVRIIERSKNLVAKFATSRQEVADEEKRLRKKKRNFIIIGVVLTVILAASVCTFGLAAGGVGVFAAVVGVVGAVAVASTSGAAAAGMAASGFLALFATLGISASVLGKTIYDDLSSRVSTVGASLDIILKDAKRKNELESAFREIRRIGGRDSTVRYTTQGVESLVTVMCAANFNSIVAREIADTEKIQECLKRLTDQVIKDSNYFNIHLQPLVDQLDADIQADATCCIV